MRVVYIADAKAEAKPETVDFDQKGCDYVPHVLAFPAGSTVKIKNDDGILHNIHTYSNDNPSINIAQPKFKKVVDVTVAKPELIKVDCDAHGWMHGWWFSASNPYYRGDRRQGQFHHQGCGSRRLYRDHLAGEAGQAGAEGNGQGGSADDAGRLDEAQGLSAD